MSDLESSTSQTPASTSFSKTSFEEALADAHRIKKEFVDKNRIWYARRLKAPNFFFRTTGILIIVISATLPALASNPSVKYPHLLTTLSIAVAALTGLGAFYRWERTWRGRISAEASLEQVTAKWELEMTNARLLVPDEDKIAHVYNATNDLLSNVRNIISAETEGFFTEMKFPQSSSGPKE